MGTAQDYAKWIVENQDKQGSPEFETVAKAYEMAKSTDGGSRTAYGTVGQGINVGMANIFGAPVDLANTALGFVGLGSERPFGGSASLKDLAAKIPTGSGPLVYRSLNEVSPEMRPLARAGEAIGGSAPIAAAPYMATRAVSELPSLVQPIVQAARNSPRAFAATEAGSALGAAQGAGLAELFAPGNQLAGTAGEIAGGFVNPLGLVSKAASATGSGIKNLAGSYTRSGREAAAAKAIQDAMVAAGEDPARVAQLLRSADLEGISLSAGQKGDSPTLMALEATLAAKNPNFDATMQTNVRNNMVQLRSLIGKLEFSGDPQLLKEAAKLRGKYFDSLLQGRLQAAQAKMEKAATSIGGDKASSSARATEILEEALTDARKVEKGLWNDVPKDANLLPDNTIKAHKDITEGSYKERPAPPGFIEDFVKRLSSQGGVTSGELLSFRSDMLARGRQSRSQKDWVNARIYENMADGALADLAAMEGNAASKAREFSRSMHEHFSKTFASDALAVKGTGGDRIVPEAVLQRGYGSGGVLAEKRFAQLEDAAKFSGKSMMQEQEEFLRAAATASVDPQTGRVNPRSLEGFLRNNGAMLERFPSLKKDLATASSAEQAFLAVSEAGDKASRAIQQRSAFSQLLQNENPSQAISNVVNSQNPQQGFAQLVKLAKRGPEGAVDGLKASTLDYAAKRATSSAGDFSFDKYREILTRPIGRGPSLLQAMTSRGVMDAAEADRLQFILRNAERIQTSLSSKAKMGELVSQPDALFDLVVRAVGANIGGGSALGQASGAPLVMAGAGARAARKLFEKVPRTRIMDVMQEAAANPRFMATLLEKPATPARAVQIERQINAFLIQAGISQEEESKRVPD